MLSSPRPDLCISRSIGLLCVAQGRLQVFMPQSLPNGRQTHSAIDEFSGMRVPKLMERASNACLRAVVVPAFLHRLVAQWSSAPVLFCPEQWSMLVAHAFEVGPQLLHQALIVEQNRSSLATFPHSGQVFIVQ